MPDASEFQVYTYWMAINMAIGLKPLLTTSSSLKLDIL